MFALLFESPERLWWSFALLIPLFVHLLRRRRFKSQPWGAMQFVLQAVQQESQKAKLQNLILMMLRVAILGMFLFAISAPSTGLHRPNVGEKSNGTHHILIIDSTYSSGTIDEKTGLAALEEAKQKASEYVRSLPDGDVVSVLTIGDFQNWVIEVPGDDFQQVATAINEIQPQPTGGKLGLVFELGAELAAKSRKQDPKLFFTQFVVFSDMERDVWDEILLQDGQSQSSMEKVTELGQLSVVDCRVDPVANIAIKELTIKYPQGAFASEITVFAELDCYYKKTNGKVGISWFLDNEFIVRDEVVIGAGETTTIEMSLNNLSSGSHQIEARLDEDSLLIDNHRWLAFDTPARVRVLCVDGAKNASVAVRLAFAPRNSPDWPVYVHTINEVEFEQQHLEEFDVIALCQLEVLSDFNARRLLGFVKQGGTLLITPGNSTDQISYNNFYASISSGSVASSPGIRWGKVVGNPSLDQAQSGVRVTDHAIASLFRRNPKSGIRALPVYKYVELDVASDRTSEIVLELSNGAPLLLCSAVGKGHVLTIGTSVAIGQEEDRWSDLGTWPSFLPLIHETMKYVVEQGVRTSNIKVGVFPERRVPMQYGPVSIAVQGPDGQTQEYAMEFSRDSDSDEVYAYWWHTEFKNPGVYYVNQYSDDQVIDTSLVVGNLAVTESAHDLIEFSTLTPFSNVRVDTSSEGSLEFSNSSRGFSRELLMLTMILMVLETISVTIRRGKYRQRRGHA